ncbi:sup-46 [Pristionchus pacificus]|uniref:RNA binding protein n=1 Tax=Pristionchus pacificus TaxID=54126 RepID=A0A2A6BMS3_PRIPA|nr:sup-46 [Pristionchus pacificus]|eukprot:PDM67205.1 RNA binding protein [Pristionchus pacificus]
MSRDMRRRSRSRSPRRGGGGDFRGSYGENKYVYLSNLPYELRWMELKTLIREKAGEVTFVEIIEQRNGRPKGCALVEFTTIEGARDAIGKLNGVEMQGRNIVAKDIKNPEAFFKIIKEETGIDFLDKGRGGSGGGAGGPRGGPGGGPPRRPESPPRNGGSGEEYELYGLSPQFLKKMAITPPLSNRIFACNIAFNATSGNIWDIFSMAGKVTYVDLQIDKEGKSKGQALVEFTHPLEAVQAISMFHNQKYYDRTLAVKMDRFEKRNKLGKGEMPRGLASIGMGLGAGTVIGLKRGEMPRGLASIGMGLGAGGAPLTDIASVISTMPQQEQLQPMQQAPPPQMAPPPFMQQMQLQQQPMGGVGGPMGRDMDIMSQINGAIGLGGAPMGMQQQQQEYKPDPSMYGGPQRGGYGDAGAPPAAQQQQLQLQQAQQQQYGAPQGAFGASPARGAPSQTTYGREPVFRDNAPVFGGNPMGGQPQGGYNANGGAYGSGGGGGGTMGGGYPQIKKEDYAPAYSGAYPDQRMGQQQQQPGGGGQPFSSRVILIKNLPLDYTWQIVRDRSMTFGEVEHCDLVSPGVARVRFSLNSEAERARGALAGTSVEGRPITVDFVM